jgi:YesN/AraC family two-component response regulator
MPKMTGIQVLYEIRRAGIDVPYVILSGYGDKQNIAHALSLNATDFLEKPFQHEELVKILDRTLDLGRAFRALNMELDRLVSENKIKKEDLEALKKAKVAMVQMKFNNEFKK